MTTSCFFTGHRILKICDELIDRLSSVIIELIESGVTDFYAGGAIGWDTLCENTILNLKERFPQIKLHLVLPCAPETQCEKWSPSQKEEYYKIYKLADSVEILSRSYYNGCMKKRNARLTELGKICVCYWNGSRQGGTYQTVNIAAAKKIKIINLYNSENL